MRRTRQQELKRAIETGDWTRFEKIRHWSGGGYYRPIHLHLRRARRMAEKKCHLLCRFRSGAQAHGKENGDPHMYCAECRRCKRFVAVDFYDRDNPKIYGPALNAECE